MKFKSFEIRKCVGVNAKRNKYEVVKWSDEPLNGKPYCWVVAFIRWDEKEPCWEFDCVGTRFIDYYEDGLCGFIRKFIEVIDFVRKNEESEVQEDE